MHMKIHQIIEDWICKKIHRTKVFSVSFAVVAKHTHTGFTFIDITSYYQFANGLRITWCTSLGYNRISCVKWYKLPWGHCWTGRAHYLHIICIYVYIMHNNMKFNNEFYKQIKGTAMSKWVQYSLQLTQLYRWDILKSNFIVSVLLNAEYIKENWNRFLDDCCPVLRSRAKLALKSFIHFKLSPSIQFTMEYSKDQIPFLDILIKRNESNIGMDLTINPQTHKGVYLLHPITQTIVNETSHIV